MKIVGVLILLATAYAVYHWLGSRSVRSQTISAICPNPKDKEVWAGNLEVPSVSRAVLESSIAELFLAHRAILAATDNEPMRIKLMTQLRDEFLSRFQKLAKREGLSRDDLAKHIADRLLQYDAVLNKAMAKQVPDGTFQFPHKISENMGCDPMVGMVIASEFIGLAARKEELLKQYVHLQRPDT